MLEQLKAARDLIALPHNWTRNESARANTGRPVDPTGPEAVCWCAPNDTFGHAAVMSALDAAIADLEKAA